MAHYFMTNFSQEMSKCPHCNEKKVFVRRQMDFATVAMLPFFPKQKQAVAYCRNCIQVIPQGTDTKIDLKLQEALDGMEKQKWMYSGAVLVPVAILGVVLTVLLAG